jgi:hypothetical protein
MSYRGVRSRGSPVQPNQGVSARLQPGAWICDFSPTQLGCMGRGRYIKANHVVHLATKSGSLDGLPRVG